MARLCAMAILAMPEHGQDGRGTSLVAAPPRCATPPRIDFGKRGVASRYPSAPRRTGLATDGFLRGSSPIRAAL